MRVRRMRIRGTHNLTEQHQFRVTKTVFLENRIERHVFSMVSEFTAFDIERNRVQLLRPGRHFVPGNKNELSLRINEALDKPWASYSVHFDFLTCNPFHFSLRALRNYF